MSSVKSWLNVEVQKSITGKFPAPLDMNHEVYLAWIRDCDARKGHSLVISDPGSQATQKVNDLLKVRTLLFRGQLDQANSKGNSLERLWEGSKFSRIA